MKNTQKVRTGLVVSDKMDKTRTIVVERKFVHSTYGKIVKKKTKFKVHDEKNLSKSGDVIKVEETRPLSKTKRWKLLEIIEKSNVQ